MRKVLILGFVLVCVTALSFLSVMPLERKSLNPDGTTTVAAPAKPSQVEVTNFPTVQAISGTVSGTVNVGNLPLDESGNLRTACAVTVVQPRIHFVGITQASVYSDDAEALTLNRTCDAEFPGTRACERSEVLLMVPVPSLWSQPIIWTNGRACITPQGGTLLSCNGNTAPVACCGF